jgi:hypothetical protein
MRPHSTPRPDDDAFAWLRERRARRHVDQKSFEI